MILFTAKQSTTEVVRSSSSNNSSSIDSTVRYCRPRTTNRRAVPFYRIRLSFDVEKKQNAFHDTAAEFSSVAKGEIQSES